LRQPEVTDFNFKIDFFFRIISVIVVRIKINKTRLNMKITKKSFSTQQLPAYFVKKKALIHGAPLMNHYLFII